MIRHISIIMILMMTMLLSVSAYDKDAVFTDLLSNDAEGKAVFRVDNPIKDAGLDLVFIEECGYVESYKIYHLTTCEKDIDEPIYGEPYQECSDGKNLSGIQCFETRDIIGYNSYKEYHPCKKEMSTIPLGNDDYEIDADIVAEHCDDGSFGYKIDWIPELKKGDDIIRQEKWAWWNLTFDYCRNIEIMNSTENFTDFPIFISIYNTTGMSVDGNGTAFVNNVCNETGAKLDHEIEMFNSTEGHVWVKIPEITTDNTTIAMYYGGDENDNSDPESLWSDFDAVWHMTELNDSTSSDFDLTSTNGEQVDGNLGAGYYFDGTAYLRDSTLGSFGSNLNGIDKGTSITGWLKYNDSTSYTSVIGYTEDGTGTEYTIQLSPNTGTAGEWRIYIASGAGALWKTFGGGYNNNNWHHFVLNISKFRQEIMMWVDGTKLTPIASASSPALMIDFAQSPNIGAMHDVRGAGDANSGYYKGSLDELRLNNKTIYSQARISYEFRSVSNQSEYISIGDQILAPPPVPYTSVNANKGDIPDADIVLTTYVNVSKFEINILEDTNLVIAAGMNVEKTTGAGANDVYIRIYNTTGADITTQLLRTVSTVGDVGSVSIKPVSTFLDAGNHNLTFAFRRTGSGTVHLDNADVVLMQLKSNNSNDIRGSIEEGIYTYSSATETVSETINITTSGNREVVFCMRETVSKTTDGEADLYIRANNTFTGEMSPYWGRSLSSATDIGNIMGAWRFNLSTANMSINIQARQDDAGDTVTSNYSMLNIDMMDNSSTRILSFLESHADTDTSSTVSYGAGTHDILSAIHTPQSGDSILVIAQFTTRSSSAIQTPEFFINTSSISGGDCLSVRERYHSSSTDVGNVQIEFLCNETIPDSQYNITAHVTVAGSETLEILDESLTGFDANSFLLTSLNTGPVIVTACSDTVNYHNTNLNCAFDFDDPQGDTLTYYTNDSRVTIAGSSVTDDPTLSDYNLPGGWDITINATDGELWASFEFNYGINDTAPGITPVNITPGSIQPGDTPTFYVNITDPELDNATVVNLTWLINGVSSYNDDWSDVVSGTVLNSTYGGVALSENDIINITIFANDSQLWTNTSISYTVGVTTVTNTTLAVGQCPDTIPGQMSLWLVVVVCLFLIAIGVISAGFFALFGGLGLLVVSWTLVGCSGLVGWIVALVGLATMIWSVAIKDPSGPG